MRGGVSTRTAKVTSLERYRGCLLGGAAGDALGAAIEFEDLSSIRSRFGPTGIDSPARAYGRVGAITDDTQMTLFTAEGLLQADDRLDSGIANPPAVLGAAYLRWLNTQGQGIDRGETAAPHGELHREPALRHRRAPGNTCLSALRAMDRSDELDRPADNDSKGCGGVMRAAPCGLVDEHWGADGPFRIGVASAALTHGHPSGSLAAGALAVIIERLRHGDGISGAVARAIERLNAEPDSEEVSLALAHALSLVGDTRPTPETIELIGQGWVAEEALAIAVYCVAALPEDLECAVRVAANHSGDSDSTAAIAGNIAGTLLGAGTIPERWLEVLEARDLIDRLAVALHERFVEGRRSIEWRLWDVDDLSEPPSAHGSDRSRDRGVRPPPPHDAYWVEPGRVMAGPYPGARDGDEAESKLRDYLDAGITCFLDLTEEGESGLRPYAALLRQHADRRGVEVVHLRIPVSDLDVPPPWRMRVIQAAIREAAAAGHTLYVHCWGGVGRTGTVVGCRLIETLDLSGREALARTEELRRSTVRSNRPSPETADQREMVLRWRKEAFGERS